MKDKKISIRLKDRFYKAVGPAVLFSMGGKDGQWAKNQNRMSVAEVLRTNEWREKSR